MTGPNEERVGRRVVLSGATGGIGRAVAERLARSGAELILLGRRAEALREEAERLGARALTGDLTDDEFVEGLRAAVADCGWGLPDVIIHNAGVFALAPFEETTISVFDRHLTVNLRAPFLLTRLWLPDMLARGSGQIITVGSMAGRRALPGNAAYSASKFGLRGLHEVLVEELRGTGVRATWVEPSAVDTPLWDSFESEGGVVLPSRAEMLRPEAVADAVHFVVTRPPDVSIQEIVIRANARKRRSS